MSKEIAERCSCKLYVVGDDLDPGQVTTLLGVEPTEAHRRGDHSPRINREGEREPTNHIVRRGRWVLALDKEKQFSWEKVAQLEYWCAFLTSRESAIRELQTRGYEVKLDCFVDEGPIVYIDLPALLMQILGNLGVALKFGVYDSTSEEFQN